MNPDETAKLLLQDRLPLTAFLRSLVRDRLVAEDLFQEVCVQAIRAADTLADADHVLRWARRAGRHRAMDHLRRSKTASEYSLDDAVMQKLEVEAIAQVGALAP